MGEASPVQSALLAQRCAPLPLGEAGMPPPYRAPVTCLDGVRQGRASPPVRGACAAQMKDHGAQRCEERAQKINPDGSVGLSQWDRR